MAAGVNLESEGVADDAIACQDASYAAAGSAVRDGDEDTLGGEALIGLRDAIPEPAGGP